MDGCSKNFENVDFVFPGVVEYCAHFSQASSVHAHEFSWWLMAFLVSGWESWMVDLFLSLGFWLHWSPSLEMADPAEEG
nr:hypothetical protein Iba_chr10bCG7120 [Ipomoea batatas]